MMMMMMVVQAVPLSVFILLPFHLAWLDLLELLSQPLAIVVAINEHMNGQFQANVTNI